MPSMGRGAAAHAAGWIKKQGGKFSVPTRATGIEPTWPVVELFLNEAWVDISSYVYYRDLVEISGGTSSEGGQADPSSCRFTVNNRDGRFSPRNPLGAYYGQIGRNTPIRVSVVRGGERFYRFYGEVSSWPTRWEQSGNDAWAEVEAAGIMRRLEQGSTPLKSPLFRDVTNSARTGIVAYWPLEDGADSQEVSSGLPDDPSMTFTGTPVFEAYEGLAGSEPLPTLGNAVLTGVVPAYTPTGETSFRMWMQLPAALAGTRDIAKITTTGTLRTWLLQMDTSNRIQLVVVDELGVSVVTTGFVNFSISTGDLFAIVLELTKNGTATDYRLAVEDYTGINSITQSFPVLSISNTIAANDFIIASKVAIGSSSGVSNTAFGHVVVADDIGAFSTIANSAVAWQQGNPGSKFLRLCGENGISAQFVTNGLSGNTVSMGKQTTAPLLDELRGIPETDLGMMIEARDQFALYYRSRLTLYNQSAALTLDYSANQLGSPLAPTDDDRYTRNDVTVTRSGGASARTFLASGALSVQAPPAGVGVYDDQMTISLGTDAQLPNQTGWRLRAGTVDESRYPTISINLRHSTFTDDPEKMGQALSVGIGDRIVVTNPPSWLPPEDISQIVIGYSETLGVLEYDITFVCIPESAYHVLYADTGYNRLDSVGSTLTSDITSTATSFSVSTQSGSQVWADTTTLPAELPYDVTIGGEVMTVTAVSGTTSPQTFTVTRSVNGIVKAHTAGTSVSIPQPTYISL